MHVAELALSNPARDREIPCRYFGVFAKRPRLRSQILTLAFLPNCYNDAQPSLVLDEVEAGWEFSWRHSSMLVISRKKHESIVIDDSILVTVIEIRGDKVRLGIEVPRHMTVHRSEVYEALNREIPVARQSFSPSTAQAVEEKVRAEVIVDLKKMHRDLQSQFSQMQQEMRRIQAKLEQLD